MSQMRAHLLAAGLKPHHAGRVEKTILTWIKSCGPEWTVDRLKALKVWYIHKLNGERIPVDQEKSWIRCDPKGRVTGPLSSIFLLKKPRKTLDALMVYTGIYLSRPSQRQEKKFFSSVSAPPVRLGYVPYLCTVVEDFMSSSNCVYENGSDSYLQYSWSGRKFLPDTWCRRSIPNRVSALIHDFRSQNVAEALENDAIEFEISHSLGKLYPMLLEVLDREQSEDSNFVGKIGCIQEKGCKGRFIANPRITFQLGLWNTARYLQSIQRVLPTDCTYQQEAGVVWLQKKLREGFTSYSVDLSDASNHVPYRLTRHILRWCGVPARCMELLDWVSTGPYRYSSKASAVYWTKGQPLGTYPSFPAFSLTLGFVLRSIERMLGKEDTFRTLGDDVIITDERVHKRFRDFLDQHEMPVSEEKSLSGSVGEFASYLISKKMKFRPRKVIQPTQNNIQYQIQRNLELGGRIRTPFDLVTAAESILGGENPTGMSLRKRASLLAATGLCKELERPITLAWGEGLYNSLKYAIIDTFGVDEGGTFSRESYQRIVDLLDSFNWQGEISAQETQPLIVRLLRKLRLPDTVVSDPELERVIRSAIETKCPTVHPDFFRRLGGYADLRRKVVRAIKAQESIMRQSKAVVDATICDALIRILTLPDGTS